MRAAEKASENGAQRTVLAIPPSSQEIVPVEVEVPERFSRWNTGSAAAKAGAAIYEEGIEICTGNISIRLPKNTSADYLASLVKGLN